MTLAHITPTDERAIKHEGRPCVLFWFTSMLLGGPGGELSSVCVNGMFIL